MIKITKTNQIPQILTSDKKLNALNEIEEKILKDPESVDSKDFKSSIYNGKGIKAQLRQDQYDKCAYCEASLVGNYGCVEHYRPKSGWQEKQGDTLHKPGYYWLAYEWENMLCSCNNCNDTARKGNLFPLRNPATRDIEHQNIAQEEPLIINPALEDPGLFLRFDKYMAVPSIIEGKESDKGKNTIDIFDLNGCIPKNTTPARRDLLEFRKRRWNDAKEVYDLCLKAGYDEKEAINEVKNIYAKPENVFSGMFTNQDTWF